MPNPGQSWMIISIQLAYIDSSGAELALVTAPSLCTSDTRHVTSDEMYSSRERVTASFTASTESVLRRAVGDRPMLDTGKAKRWTARPASSGTTGTVCWQRWGFVQLTDQTPKASPLLAARSPLLATKSITFGGAEGGPDTQTSDRAVKACGSQTTGNNWAPKTPRST